MVGRIADVTILARRLQGGKRGAEVCEVVGSLDFGKEDGSG
jgi:hypothetical protein